MSSIRIEHVDKIVPDAFHGTSRKSAEAIAKSGFKVSTGNNQYLGIGVYFFESSRVSAEQWAQRRYPPDKCAVIQAIINLGRCLDFHNPEHASLIIEAKREIQIRQASLPDHHHEKRIKVTDAVVINFLAKLSGIDTVRASHISIGTKKVFPGSHFYNPQQLIICVRNIPSILRLKIV